VEFTIISALIRYLLFHIYELFNSIYWVMEGFKAGLPS